MKVITIASLKGGSLKSSLTMALAVRASVDLPKVAMLDLNRDQASLEQWWTLRGAPASPYLDMGHGTLAQRVAELSATYDWLFIDTPPVDVELVEAAIAAADAVLVPIRCGFLDLMAAQTVAELCQEHGRPYAFVLGAVDGRYEFMAAQAITALDDGLGPHFETRIKYRKSWILAPAMGKTGPEIDRDARPEINALWAEAQTLAKEGAR
jgi:chromosome partitioning protein